MAINVINVWCAQDIETDELVRRVVLKRLCEDLGLSYGAWRRHKYRLNVVRVDGVERCWKIWSEEILK